MYEDYGNLNTLPPNDFPYETWGGLGVGLVAAAIFAYLLLLAALWALAYRRGRREVSKTLRGDIIDKGTKAVSDRLAKAIIVPPERQEHIAERTLEMIDALFGRSLSFSKKLADAIKDLDTAIDGKKEVDPEKAGHEGLIPAHMTGGTVINIAVNQGASNGGTGDAVQTGMPVAAGGHAGVHYGEKPEHKKPVEVPYEQNVSIWLAVQKLYDDWKTPEVPATALRGAQQQLIHSPVWKDPRLELLKALEKLTHVS